MHNEFFSFVYESKMMECRLNVETLIQLNRNISVCVSGKIPREISHSLLFSPILIPGKFTTTTMVIIKWWYSVLCFRQISVFLFPQKQWWEKLTNFSHSRCLFVCLFVSTKLSYISHTHKLDNRNTHTPNIFQSSKWNSHSQFTFIHSFSLSPFTYFHFHFLLFLVM